METGIQISLLIVAILIFIGIITSFLTNFLLVPLFSTPQRVRAEILELLDLKQKEMLLDLGSGNGIFLIEAAEKYGIKGIGYEISPFGILISKILKIFRLGVKNELAIVPTNFLTKSPLPIADKIYCYLNPKAMETVGQKLKEEGTDEKTMVYAYKYPFVNIKEERKEKLKNEEYLFIYKGKSFII